MDLGSNLKTDRNFTARNEVIEKRPSIIASRRIVRYRSYFRLHNCPLKDEKANVLSLARGNTSAVETVMRDTVFSQYVF